MDKQTHQDERRSCTDTEVPPDCDLLGDFYHESGAVSPRRRIKEDAISSQHKTDSASHKRGFCNRIGCMRPDPLLASPVTEPTRRALLLFVCLATNACSVPL